MSPPQSLHVDPKMWQSCAGAAVQVPTVNSRVYYFPQGHMEHASHSTILTRSLPFVRCHVSSLDFLADPHSDEVYAKLLLTPLPYDSHKKTKNDVASSSKFLTRLSVPSQRHSSDNNNNNNHNHNDDVFVSFSKVLTPSDANNGGGFSVPRYCAEYIFPPLNFDDDPPVKSLSVTDVHGVAWTFRHIYRGTPRRHLLTTGWSTFVNHKKLVAGDSVVFMKNSEGKVFVGIRRTLRFANDELAKEGPAKEEGFSRNANARVSAEDVATAVEAAVREMPFEVVYYPRAGLTDFVVKAETVEEAVKFAWVGGMRVKIGMETEDSSRMTWFQGTVSSVSASEKGPWRMLEVSWDEPKVLQNAERVSPWQVQLISSASALHTAFPPTKRFRADLGSGQIIDKEGEPFFPMTGFPNLTVGYLNQELLSYNTFPAGMQGARHDLFSPSSISNSSYGNSYLHLDGGSFENCTVPWLGTVSTELNIGSSPSDDLSPHSQSSFHSFGTEYTGTHNSKTKVGSGSILLFGKIVQPVEGDLSDADGIGGDSSSSKETKGIVNPLDHSLTYSKWLFNRRV